MIHESLSRLDGAIPTERQAWETVLAHLATTTRNVYLGGGHVIALTVNRVPAKGEIRADVIAALPAPVSQVSYVVSLPYAPFDA